MAGRPARMRQGPRLRPGRPPAGADARRVHAAAPPENHCRRSRWLPGLAGGFGPGHDPGRFPAGRLVAVAVTPALMGLERIGRDRERRELVRPGEEAPGFRRRGRRRGRCLPLKKILETGEVFERLVDVAEGEEASLLVLGDARRTYMERVLLGRNVAKVIGYSPVRRAGGPGGDDARFCPGGHGRGRLAAEHGRRRPGHRPVRRLRRQPVRAFRPGRPRGQTPHLRHFRRYQAQGPDRHRRRGSRRPAIGRPSSPPEAQLREGSPYQTIAAFAREIDAGCLVLGSYGKSGLRRLMLGSVAERVLALAPCPVLVVKAAPGEQDPVPDGDDG